MEYFFLETHYRDAGFISGSVEFQPALNNYYGIGINIPSDKLKIIVKMDSHVRKLKKDFFRTGCGAFFASEELALLLSRKEKSVTTHPAECFYSTGRPTEKRFMLIHIKTNKIDGFDYFNSDYNGKNLNVTRIKNGIKPNLIKGTAHIVLNFQDANEHHYFFLNQVLHLEPIISESLLNDIKEKGLAIKATPV